MRNVYAWSGYPFPPSRHQPLLHPNLDNGDMLTLGTYNTNVSREPKPSKYRHISQNIRNTFNKHIIISYDDHVIIHEWNAHWMRFLIHLYILMSRLLLTCYLHSGPDVHTLLRAAIGRCQGERPQHSTGPLAKTFHMMPLHKIMSEEGIYDTPKLILIVVSLIHTYGLHVGISLIIKLIHVHVETHLTVIFLHAWNVL